MYITLFAPFNNRGASRTKMNEMEVERQIENMCRFIKQEAEEKANEIQVSAEEEFNLEKLQLLEQEKSKIRREYERREAQAEVKKKIEYSKQLNEQRIKVLVARENAIQVGVCIAECAQAMRVHKLCTLYMKRQGPGRNGRMPSRLVPA
ncbi:ATP synthase subunit-domain-containing protein [Dunaliella salina]|uniref:ATP synthase subunit-domain-containing protein n=1 Tax=Dunaliella salina TaxID=3046 RepID=A0ABQ7FVC3_DUNSA|nr:ATP synthase subunit-domain-containing protein [Dunaliella salina]|eukprot:KAF5826335.1 ATP synthase subunit-domain-containing protein [Dunaliella salina]